MFNENIFYLDGRKADKNAVISLAGITYPDPRYAMERMCSDLYVFEYVLSGKGIVESDGINYTVHKGDVYLLKKNKRHKYYSDKTDPMEKIWFNADGKIISHLVSDYGLENVTYFENFADSSLFYKMQEILTDCKNRGKPHSCEVDILIHRLICDLSKHFYEGGKNLGEADILKEYIDSHLSESFSIQSLSTLIFRSPVRTINIFKKAFGKTPYDYLLEKRIQTSCMLLKNTAMKISDICCQVGFSDSHYFSRYFRRKTGLSPKEYRNKN